jgi:oligopeptide/dipeptide ABC transporter ATP-binding protein
VSALIEVSHLTVQFTTPQGYVTAVRDVNLQVGAGEVMGLVGESGSGKSVTALAILRLLPPQAQIRGSVRFRNQDLLTIPDAAMRRIRGTGISMIFQEPMTALNPVMRVGDQIAEAVLAHPGAASREDAGPRGEIAATATVSKAEAWERAIAALRTVAIPDAERRARDYPHQLSGGQRQRVMIAMAVVNRPYLLIADEPTTALDVTIQAQVLELLNELREKFSLAMLFISHDLAVVSQVSDRIGVMYAGSMVEMGTKEQVFASAVHPYTRGLLRSVPTLRTDRARNLAAIDGTVPPIAALPPGCAFEPRCPSRIPSCANELPPLIEIAPGHLARCPVIAAEVR